MLRLFKTHTIAIYLFCAYILSGTVFAQRSNLGTISAVNPGGTIYDINFFINRFIQFAIGSAGVVFLFMFVWGSITWLSSAGDKAALQTARSRISSAAIGLIIVALSFVGYMIVRMLTYNP